ncbi:BTAD domain-containing putative transcriptional regulator [Micromonospora sp. NPDC048871]|uniref:AfsR/SARP family transcriptional regulator n=1 Tax=unclassified Micromonospora TaxID=2617518 RepID=UPI002E108ED2|nr:winged helix-turn-helix domain-containing protein [Micromonospora sp. NBC_01739]
MTGVSGLTPLKIGILGRVVVSIDEQELEFNQAMIRGLVAVLARNIGRTTSIRGLVGALWDEPPPSAEANLRSYVARLRGSFPAESRNLLVTRRASGYELQVRAEQSDLHLFRARLSAGRERNAYGDLRGAAQALQSAISLWRGPAGDDLPVTLSLQTAASGLNAERLAAIEELAEVCLRLGVASPVATYLSDAVLIEPARERSWALLARVHALLGGVTAASQTLGQARRVLAAEIGIQQYRLLDEVSVELTGVGR